MKNFFVLNIVEILRNEWLILIEFMLSCMWIVSYFIVISNNSWVCCGGSWRLCGWCLCCCCWIILCIIWFILWMFFDIVSFKFFFGRVVICLCLSWCFRVVWFGIIILYCLWRKFIVLILKRWRKVIILI